MAFCNPCMRPANSSIVVRSKRSTFSIEKLFSRQLFKKSQKSTKPSLEISSKATGRFRRMKESNVAQELTDVNNCSIETNNYDMTINHCEELQHTEIGVTSRRMKKIPRWARKSRLQLAYINQVYFNDKSPEDIFGSIETNLVHEIIGTIEFRESENHVTYYSSKLPANFV